MSKNGEYSSYEKCDIPKYKEIEWTIELKKSFIEKIGCGENLYLVVNLAELQLEENEILDGFYILSKSNNKDGIYTMIIKLSNLFENHLLFAKIVEIFR